jgi:hypothetical protein
LHPRLPPVRAFKQQMQMFGLTFFLRFYRKDKPGVLELCKNPALEPDRVINLRLASEVKTLQKKDRLCIEIKFEQKLKKTGDMVLLLALRRLTFSAACCLLSLGVLSFYYAGSSLELRPRRCSSSCRCTQQRHDGVKVMRLCFVVIKRIFELLLL